MSGGGPVVSSDIVNSMAGMGHEVTVLIPDVSWNGKRYEPPMHENLKIIRVQTPSKENLKIAARRCEGPLKKRAEEICRKTRFDLIFTIFHPFHLVPNAAVSCAKKFGIPIVIKIDDAVYEKAHGLKSIQRRIEKRFNKKALDGATEILTLNTEIKNTVVSVYNLLPEKISIMPNGIDLLFFNSKSVRERKIVFAGVMYHHRGLDVLLNAAPAIIKALPDAKIVLLGEGPEMQKLTDIISQHGISKNVEFKGWVEREEIPKYLSVASLAIGPLQLTPTTAGSIPIKVLEYMASSLPIIAKRGSVSDSVLKDGQNGYLIENADDLAKRAVEILQDKSLAEKMGNASRIIVEGFSWQRLLEPLLDKYKS